MVSAPLSSLQRAQRGMARLVVQTVASVQRMLAPVALLGAFASGGSTDARADYFPLDAMAGMARFPWVYVAVNAVASDLAGVPLVAVQVESQANRGARAIVTDPAVDLLRQPNPTTGGHLFRKQLLVDYLLTGNAFIWRTQTAIWRLHPNTVTPVIGPAGIVVRYRVRDAVHGTGEQSFSPSEIIHIRDVSWADDTRSALGHAPMATLHDDLLTELRARQMAAKQASSGRPDVFITPKGDGGWGPRGGEELVEKYEQSVSLQKRAFAFSSDINVQQLNYTPRELEFSERSAATREAVLSLYEVPPARAGLVTANYGTQRQQMRTYWESLIRRACMFDDAFSLLARFGHRVEHDFTSVEALQVAQTDRLKRVLLWTSIGATAAAAAHYEGFADAPVTEDRFAAPLPSSDSRTPEEPQGDQARASVLVEVPEVLPSLQALTMAIRSALTESATRWELLSADLEPGVELGLLTRWESERMFTAISNAGVPPQVARAYAESAADHTARLVEVLVETRVAQPGEPLGLEALEGFSERSANRMAGQILRGLREAA